MKVEGEAERLLLGLQDGELLGEGVGPPVGGLLGLHQCVIALCVRWSPKTSPNIQFEELHPAGVGSSRPSWKHIAE